MPYNGIQGNTDNTNAIDRNIWEQLPVNILQGDGSSVFTSNDQNGNPYYICSSGVQAAVYRNKLTKEIVIAYRGTNNEISDYIADVNILLNKIPENQLNDAEKFYNAVITQYSNSNIACRLGFLPQQQNLS